MTPEILKTYLAVHEHISGEVGHLSTLIGMIEKIEPHILESFGTLLVTRLLKQGSIMLRKEMR